MVKMENVDEVKRLNDLFSELGIDYVSEEIKKVTPEVVKRLLINLGFDNDSIFKKSPMRCAYTTKGRLKHHSKLKAGMYKDALYFIFRNGIPMKIGKVGGGNRCMKNRCNDYSSKSDPVGKKILESIGNGHNIDIWSLYPPTKKARKVYGFWVIPTIMPSLEKKILANAEEIGLELEWNLNKG